MSSNISRDVWCTPYTYLCMSFTPAKTNRIDGPIPMNQTCSRGVMCISRSQRSPCTCGSLRRLVWHELLSAKFDGDHFHPVSMIVLRYTLTNSCRWSKKSTSTVVCLFFVGLTPACELSWPKVTNVYIKLSQSRGIMKK